MHRITTFAAGLLALAAAGDALAAQSALVGKLHQDGTIQIYKNRFQPKFEDGTPVATIEATAAPGGPRLTRASADGCVSETTVLRISEHANPDLSHGVEAVDLSPLTIKRCYDHGCKATFEQDGWTTRCGKMGSVDCACIKEKTDQVTWYTGGYCSTHQFVLSDWRLDGWVYSQFIQ